MNFNELPSAEYLYWDVFGNQQIRNHLNLALLDLGTVVDDFFNCVHIFEIQGNDSWILITVDDINAVLKWDQDVYDELMAGNATFTRGEYYDTAAILKALADKGHITLPEKNLLCRLSW